MVQEIFAVGLAFAMKLLKLVLVGLTGMGFKGLGLIVGIKYVLIIAVGMELVLGALASVFVMHSGLEMIVELDNALIIAAGMEFVILELMYVLVMM
eukprot:CAMPEP_0168317562 /NCGR_PEP_ID=MMETSP0210-20121227/26027_1 /TAXON_ID=40633 /ORGANISM="Condylostoma magnum, Strain COL2" /LENGTH=95 /DNA_ID=CAMNT_0008318167 /DNA_START=953 /DNA_END=1237 /DNA_ORIENTATION=-